MRKALFPLSLCSYGSSDVPMPNARASAEPELPICCSGTLQTCNSLQLRYLAAPSRSSFHNHTIPDIFRSYYPANPSEGKLAMSGAYVNNPELGIRWRNCQHGDVLSNAKKRSASTDSPSGPEARLVVEPRKKKYSYNDASDDPTTDEQQHPKPPVRKSQKLGDKVNALQQLVSPFGKTDTASVLQEATICIKQLQDRIQALSMPYFQYRSSFSRRGGGDEKFDLRSRGLCLMPVSSTDNLREQETRDTRTGISQCFH
ncbi:unnamed protein product [Victoria cruziana]